MIEYFRSPTRAYADPVPPDAAVVSASSRLVLLSGVQSTDSTDAVIGGDYPAQGRGALRNIELILTDLGGSLSDIARVVLYVRSKDGEGIGESWETYVEAMGDREATATLVGVNVLGGGPATGSTSSTIEPLIEIEATAVLP